MITEKYNDGIYENLWRHTFEPDWTEILQRLDHEGYPITWTDFAPDEKGEALAAVDDMIAELQDARSDME